MYEEDAEDHFRVKNFGNFVKYLRMKIRSLMLKDRSGVKMLEKRMLGKIFGGVAKKWREFPNDEIYSFCFSPNINRVIK
jgi:hypothetical protein